MLETRPPQKRGAGQQLTYKLDIHYY